MLQENSVEELKTPEGGTLIPVPIDAEVKKAYIDYSMSVIVSRALPDVRDGLKPVHRRILYSMEEKGLRFNGPTRKCAKIVGDVLGSYHPHGDASVYDALVRLGQDFSLRYPVITPQGNFGTIAGDPPAAYRYTEAKMARLAEAMVEDIKKETVDFVPNFDESTEEPSVLPAKFPFLLANGSSGIAVGMATNMPPHNLREIAAAVAAYIDQPDISVDELSHALELTDKTEISEESNILEGIIRFGGETAKEVMTSRLDVVDLDIRTPFKDVLKCIIENAYSRIPVYAESRDNIKGILYIKDLLPHLNKGDNFRWQSLIRPAYFVPETKMIDDLLRDFQTNKIHIAIVVDEFGGTSGIVTMEDIIEEIVGEIHDEYDDEERTYAVLNDHTWVFEAKTLLTDFYKVTKIDEAEFEEVSGEADTVAGLLLELKGEFPVLHERVSYKDYEFEVLEMDSRRILKVKVTVKKSLAVVAEGDK